MCSQGGINYSLLTKKIIACQKADMVCNFKGSNYAFCRASGLITMADCLWVPVAPVPKVVRTAHRRWHKHQVGRRTGRILKGELLGDWQNVSDHQLLFMGSGWGLKVVRVVDVIESAPASDGDLVVCKVQDL